MDAVQNVSESDALNMVLDAYGTIEIYERADLDELMAKEGDIKMDSGTAATIISKIENQLGRELPEPCDLRPEQFSSVKNLVSLIVRKIKEGPGKPLKKSKTAVPAMTGK